MKRLVVVAAVLIGSWLMTGCTGVKVFKVNSPAQEGVRYYRPKPYLFITGKAVPAEEPQGGPTLTIQQQSPLEVKQAAETAYSPRCLINQATYLQDPPVMALPEVTLVPDQMSDHVDNNKPATFTAEEPPLIEISMQLQYLPDFAEEYAIQYKPGLGSGKLKLTLENGWNLTSLDTEADQKTDEIIGSVASLIGAFPAPKAEISAMNALKKPIEVPRIYATNVPFGYYEAIVACDPATGKKQLYGWRYVGFMPFQACPVDPSGSVPVCCDHGDIYGLAHVNGVLQFVRIGEIPPYPQPKIDIVKPKPNRGDKKSTEEKDG